MSGRRGQSRSSAAIDESEGHSSSEIEADSNDPIINAIRYGMDSIMKIANDTVPFLSTDDETLRDGIGKRMEAALLKLMEAELAYSQTNSVVNHVVEELNLQDGSDLDIKDFTEAIDKIPELANKEIAEYKATLTPDILRSHPTFLRMQTEMENLFERGEGSEVVDTADAETEPDEVDLEDSTMDDDDEFHEIIPELDPISKQPLRDPVRNRICNHIYGKSAMLQLLKKNPKTRCPAMGCGNNQFVRAGDLFEDPRLTAKVLGLPMPSIPSTSSRSPRRQASPKKKAKGRRRR